MKMKANPENPAYSCAVKHEFKKLFNNKPGTIPTLGITLQPHLEDMEVDLDAISVVRPPECPPWHLQQTDILFNLSDLREGDTCPLVFQSMLLELFSRFSRHRKVYTDGSKKDKRTEMSFVCDDHEFSCRINDEASICTAELLAIEAARLLRVKNTTTQLFPIFCICVTTCLGTRTLFFCWVPSHIGIQGNERADVLAKAALDKIKQFYYTPYTDFKYSISIYLDDIWTTSGHVWGYIPWTCPEPLIKLSITRHALSPPPSHHHLYTFHLIN